MEQDQGEKDLLQDKEEVKEGKEEEIVTEIDRYPPHQEDSVNVQAAVMKKPISQEHHVLR